MKPSRRMFLRVLTGTITLVFSFVVVAQVYAWVINSITHTWDPNFSGGSILTTRCLTANYHWLTSAEISPNPALFGPWKYGAINGCTSHYPIVGFTTEVVKICVGASDTDPGNGSVLYEHDNNRCYVCSRPGGNLNCTEVFAIYGHITDSSGIALSGVSVSDGAGHTATTDINGNYAFGNLTNGLYTLTPSKMGYTFTPLSRGVSGGPPYNVRGQDFTGTPIVQTYSISGRIADGSNVSIPSVSVTDGAGHTATTDASGNFAFSGLPPGSYTLTPSKSGYTFNPANRAVSVPPDVTSQNFTGTAIVSTYSISGRIADGNNVSIPSVSVTDGAGHTATTDANGNFAFSGLPSGSYTLTPSKSGYIFSPSSRAVSVPPDVSGQNFSGSRQVVHTDTQLRALVENNQTTIWLKVCGYGASHRFRSIQLAPSSSILGEWTRGAIDGCSAEYRAVINATVGDQFRFYSTVTAGPISENTFLQQSRKDSCTVMALGTIQCQTGETPPPQPTPAPAPASRTLSVKYVDQVYVQRRYDGAWRFCGPSSVAMFLNYKGREGRDVSVDRAPTMEIANQIYYSCCGTLWPPLIDLLINNNINATDPGSGTPLSFAEIKTSINNGNPIIMGVGAPENQLIGQGHILLVVGYRDPNIVIVHDPFGGKYWGPPGDSRRNDIPWISPFDTPRTKGQYIRVYSQ